MLSSHSDCHHALHSTGSQWLRRENPGLDEARLWSCGDSSVRAQGKGTDYCNTCSCVDDLAFVEAVLDALQAEFCTDKARVYATGMSHGGMMTYQVPFQLLVPRGPLRLADSCACSGCRFASVRTCL